MFAVRCVVWLLQFKRDVVFVSGTGCLVVGRFGLCVGVFLFLCGVLCVVWLLCNVRFVSWCYVRLYHVYFG